ncbi:MAG: WGR domain-containing protein [Archangium sp.]
MRLEFVEGTSKKFWEAALDGTTLVVKWGRIGTAGQEKKYPFPNAREAREEHDALVQEKLKKGYQRTDAPKAPPRNADLEAAMFDALDDAAPALVYADWLQSNGNPWGELISVQYALEKKPKDKALKKREATLLKDLPLPHKDLGTVSWRRGCIDAIHFFNEQDWMDNGYDVLPLARGLFDLPHCGGLRELRTGVIRWDSNTEDVPNVLAEAAKRPFASRVKRLFLGDIPDNVDMDHHTIGDVRKVSKQFPGLTELKLHSGAASWSGPTNFEFGPLALPKLKTLIIETCGLTSKRAKQLTDSTLPELESLEVWVGSPEHSANAKLKDLAPILEGKKFPKVTKLGLMNNEFSNELAAALVKSPIAARLESLSLSMGVLSESGVKALCAGASAFPKLKTLDVSDSYVVAADVKALKKAFAKLEVIAKNPKEIYPDDPTGRYVSVHE